MQRRPADSANWHMVFRALLGAGPQVPAENLIAPADCAALVSSAATPTTTLKIHNMRQSDRWLVARVEGEYRVAPLGHWAAPEESAHAEQWLALLTFLQAVFDLVQIRAGAERRLLPGSADIFRMDANALQRCLRTGEPLQVLFEQVEDVGGGMQVHWWVQTAAGHTVLHCHNLVLFRIDAQRIAGRASLQAAQKKAMPAVDLSGYGEWLAHMATAPVDQIAAQIESRLLTQLSMVTGSDVSADQALFGLGIDSLWAMDFRARLQQELQLELPLTFLLKGPTVEQLSCLLAQQVHGRGRRDEPAMAPVRQPADEIELTL